MQSSAIGQALPPRTLYQKIWDAHVVAPMGEEAVLLYIDRHLVNEVTSPQAFEALRLAGRTVARPDTTIAVADHAVPTDRADRFITDPDSRLQVETLERNVEQFKLPYLPLRSQLQGIIHVVAPELGLTLPGQTIVCGDSHTSTHGAFGALAFGIGTTQVEHVLATQTLVQSPTPCLRIDVEGALQAGVFAKDIILAAIACIGAGGANRHVIEFTGPAITAMDMSQRMTMCNMSIEAGARAGLIAPDMTTLAYLKGRPLLPQGRDFDDMASDWLKLASDPDANYARTVSLDADTLAPHVTWGTSPHTAVPIDATIPSPESTADDALCNAAKHMLDYMGLSAGTALRDIQLDAIFIGSCTNARIEDLRAAAQIVKGRKIASGLRALVVPGSGMVRRQAEVEGLDRIFTEAGFSWRQPGCSMCLGMNDDRLSPGERCASTSNRNFEGRQGPGGRSHLVSPAMAAASALTGRLTDPRDYL